MSRKTTLRRKMLLIFIPLVLVTGGLVSAVSYFIAKNELTYALEETMKNQSAEIAEMTERRLVAHQRIADSLSSVTTSLGSNIDKNEYQSILEQIVWNNEDTLGAGVWFEPYQYDPQIEFFGSICI